MNEEQTPIPETEPFVASPELIATQEVALKEIRSRSFAGRHPELGKMVNCPVCDLRHRDSQKCEQKFKELWIEEDLETGEKEIIYATPPPPPNRRQTTKMIVGAKQFKGKRRLHRPNPNELHMIELTRKFFPNFEGIFDTEEKQMKAARKLAIWMFHHIRKRKAEKRRRQQDISRKINNGLLPAGTKV